MADQILVGDMPKALAERAYPTVVSWNRLEGRPRTVNFERALRAEIRDALWMVSRQWQLGEFQGEDAGSPVFAKTRVTTTKLSRFQPGDGPVGNFDETAPLEMQVERLPLRLTLGNERVGLDLRLTMGRRWLRLIGGIGNYASLFITKYKFAVPDPTRVADAPVCAHPRVWQAFAAVAERAMDGGALYQYLLGASGRHAYDGVAVLDTHKSALDAAAAKFIAWVGLAIATPDGVDNPAWLPPRFEYRVRCSAPTASGDKTYVADEYSNGSLNWHNVDLDPSAALPAGTSTTTSDPQEAIVRTMIPVPVTYPGMPHPRWWAIEDSRTNFGEIQPDTTDLAKLLFIEFGLVYSNDWFLIPFTLPSGSVATISGLVVSTVFGERFWIDAAGSGADDNWQRWSLWTVNVRGNSTAAADTSLLFLPTVPKIQEGAPLEQVMLLRDEMANVVWAVEKTVPLADGRGSAGTTAGRETRAYFERLVASAGGAVSTPAQLPNDAKIRYDVMSTAPEHWIPFIPVRAHGSSRAIELQRAALPRIIDGDPLPPVRVRPRTSLLRSGLDQASPQPYFVPEEEVPRAGALVTLRFRRTRWLNGQVFVWAGVRKQTGRGEGSSGIAFDRLIKRS